MDKNELKQARRELVSMMHLMREKQATRRTQIIENPGKKYNVEIDNILIKLATNNVDYYSVKPTEEDKEFIDNLINDLKEMKKKKRK